MHSLNERFIVGDWKMFEEERAFMKALFISKVTRSVAELKGVALKVTASKTSKPVFIFV